MQIWTTAVQDPRVLFQGQLVGAIKGVHIHLADPSVCITQAQIICVYRGKLGQSSPRRWRKRPPHVDFKKGCGWVEAGVSCPESGARWARLNGWMEEGRKAGPLQASVCVVHNSMQNSSYNAICLSICHNSFGMRSSVLEISPVGRPFFQYQGLK